MSALAIRTALACGDAACPCRAARAHVHCPVPTHGKGRGDRSPSLTVDDGEGGKVLVHCFAGCDQDAVIGALSSRGLWQGIVGDHTPPDVTATLQPLGVTLEAYAAAKQLPVDALRSFGLKDTTYAGHPAIRIPYVEDGRETAVRFRTALSGKDRFRWKVGARPTLYGLHRAALARERGYVVLVEGESDCHVAWYHDVPALGVPGASTFREARDARHLADVPVVYVVVEPDNGGESLVEALSRSSLRDQIRLVRLLGFKDLAELHVADPEAFDERWEVARASSVPLTIDLAERAQQQRIEAAEQAHALIHEPDILACFSADLRRLGVIGEERAAKLVFLSTVSRLLSRPVSIALKGPSSAGKSYTVEQTLRFFPADAFYALSGMSEHALAYGTEPLSHRMLVLYEAAGMSGEFASYLLRSLLSEGRVRYETVVKTAEGLEPRLVEREGPTGLIVTTTAISLHPENETRMLSIPLTDTSAQTAAILLALAGGTAQPIDFTAWHALHSWLAAGDARVTIPYATDLARLIPPVAVRLRRDFGALLNLIKAHALLHQGTREAQSDGQIVATMDDYLAVRALVADLVADGVGMTVSSTMRETVFAVAHLIADGEETTVTEVARELKLDKSSTQRRVRAAIDRGFVQNLEDRRGRPARLVLGDAMPEERELLPSVERLQGCSASGGDSHLVPLPIAVAAHASVEEFDL